MTRRSFLSLLASIPVLGAVVRWFVNAWNRPSFSLKGVYREWGFIWQIGAAYVVLKSVVLAVWLWFPGLFNVPPADGWFEPVLHRAIATALLALYPAWFYFAVKEKPNQTITLN